MVRLSDIMVSETPLWQVIAGVSFVILFFGYALIRIAKETERADRRQYPGLGQVQAASDKQITWWINNLPKAKSQREHNVISLILAKHLNNINPDNPIKNEQ